MREGVGVSGKGVEVGPEGLEDELLSAAEPGVLDVVGVESWLLGDMNAVLPEAVGFEGIGREPLELGLELELELDDERTSCGKPVGKGPPETVTIDTEVDVDEPDGAPRVDAEVEELKIVDVGASGFPTGILKT